MSMLAKVHRRDLDLYSKHKRRLQTQYASHLGSSLDSAKKHTKLLELGGASELSAVSIMRIVNTLDSDFLPFIQEAQRFLDSLTILALYNGATHGGLDQISTLQSLRSVLVHLSNDSRYAKTAETLVESLPHLLPVSASKDPSVELVEQQLSVHFVRLGILRTLGKKYELRKELNCVLDFVETYRAALGPEEVLAKKILTLGVLEIESEREQIPDLLERLDGLIPQLEKDFDRVSEFYIFKAQMCRAKLIARLGKKQEAIEATRSLLQSAKNSTELSNNIILQLTYQLNGYLITENSHCEIAENCKYVLGLLNKELSPFHEEALLQKRNIIENERRHAHHVGLITFDEHASEPRIFGVDHCHELTDAMITITLELAIAYKAFGMDEDIEPLWNGVLKHARYEEVGINLIDAYIKAFEATANAADKQGYHYYGLLFRSAITQMQKSYDENRAERGEPRYEQLGRLR